MDGRMIDLPPSLNGLTVHVEYGYGGGRGNLETGDYTGQVRETYKGFVWFEDGTAINLDYVIKLKVMR